ncbi:hypothetical protein V6N12_033054 [Hibiscus sabdariffa]|uniref:Uncharacterized protein n=1 Tax=Hibiscus sabdariffa TaxID=183260 RepID=A0ABR2CEV0_9ROSI
MEEATSRIKSTCAGKGPKTVVSHPEADGAIEATGAIGATWAGIETGVGAAGALIGGAEATEGVREWDGRARVGQTKPTEVCFGVPYATGLCKRQPGHAHRKRQAHWPAPMVWRTIASSSAQEAARKVVRQEPSIASSKKQCTGAEAEPRVLRPVHTSTLKT